MIRLQILLRYNVHIFPISFCGWWNQSMPGGASFATSRSSFPKPLFDRQFFVLSSCGSICWSTGLTGSIGNFPSWTRHVSPNLENSHGYNHLFPCFSPKGKKGETRKTNFFFPLVRWTGWHSDTASRWSGDVTKEETCHWERMDTTMGPGQLLFPVVMGCWFGRIRSHG